MFMLVYVDDIILTGSSPQALQTFTDALGRAFLLRDLGPLDYYLGISLQSQPDGSLFLSQRQYIVDLLTRMGMTSCKGVQTPLSSSQPMTTALPDDPLYSDSTRYRQAVGALQYVTLTRPDLAFAVNRVCQFMHAPQESHWEAVKRILRYLQATKDLGMVFRPLTSLQVSAFSDADWAGSPDDRRSTGGHAIFFGTNLVSWMSRKQRTVSRSSTEAEYKSLADCASELSWIISLFTELGIAMASPPILWCDNIGATYLAANPVYHARTKHIEIDYHFVREKLAAKQLQIHFVSTKDQIADIFTKALPLKSFVFFRDKLQVGSPPLACEGGIRQSVSC